MKAFTAKVSFIYILKSKTKKMKREVATTVDKENNDNNNLDEIQEFIEQQLPINTTKKTTYNLNVWKWYCDIVHESRALEEILANELNIMNWKFLLILRGTNRYVIHRPGSLWIGKNCALGLIMDLGYSFPLSGPCSR